MFDNKNNDKSNAINDETKHTKDLNNRNIDSNLANNNEIPELENPTAENLQNLYACVLDTEDMALPESYIEEDILIDSIEVMVNASQSKIRDLGAYDVIEVQNKGKKTQILLLADEEYEIIEG